MANLRDIRRRIKSVKNTRQITRAMQLVSSSKMKRAQDAALAGRPYAFILGQMLHTVSRALQASGADIEHPFFEKRSVKRRGILLLSTDKGLWTAQYEFVPSHLRAGARRGILLRLGKRALSGRPRGARSSGCLRDFGQSGKQGSCPFGGFSDCCLQSGSHRHLGDCLSEPVNARCKSPSCCPSFPFSIWNTLAELKKKIKGDAELEIDESRAITFEPSAADILASLPERYVEFMIYQMILESRASEYSARMVAMKSATDNASKLVDSLTLDYNKARQAAITQEILEIAAASAA